jgi:hypothetical protein
MQPGFFFAADFLAGLAALFFFAIAEELRARGAGSERELMKSGNGAFGGTRARARRRAC